MRKKNTEKDLAGRNEPFCATTSPVGITPDACQLKRSVVFTATATRRYRKHIVGGSQRHISSASGSQQSRDREEKLNRRKSGPNGILSVTLQEPKIQSQVFSSGTFPSILFLLLFLFLVLVLLFPISL